MTTLHTQRSTDALSCFGATGASIRADSVRGDGCVFGWIGDTRTIADPVAA